MCRHLEEAEITKLIQQTDQVQTELEEEERCHNEWRALIKGVDPTSKRLSVLLEGRATLEALTSLPPALNQECSNRLREIAKAVSTIEKQVERAVSALDTITDRSNWISTVMNWLHYGSIVKRHPLRSRWYRN